MGVALVLGCWLAASAVVSVVVGAVVARAEPAPDGPPVQHPLPPEPATHRPAALHLVGPS